MQALHRAIHALGKPVKFGSRTLLLVGLLAARPRWRRRSVPEAPRVRPRRRGLFHRPQGRRDRAGEAQALFRVAQHGHCAGGLGPARTRDIIISWSIPSCQPSIKPIPNDFNHLHFGAGQTEAEITLKPGQHTLQLLMGDKDHIPHTPPVMSQRIRVRVEGAPEAVALTGGPSASPPGAEVYFTDPIKDGAVLPPKFTMYFGLKNMGLAPAGTDRPNSGHHHLLIDTDLPPLDQPIPNDFNHLHFGVGQSEAEITLKAGQHTLQLLLGRQGPHPAHAAGHVEADRRSCRRSFTAQTVASRRARLFCRTGRLAYLPPKATIRFGLSNMGVAPAGIERANTGHHHLLIDTQLPPLDDPIPNDFNHLHFGAGQTEAVVNLPLGRHTLQLLLGDENHVPHNPPVMSKPLKVIVTRTGRRPNG